MIRAKIITIGDEILIGQIVDTNSTFISNELIKIGVEVCEILSIRDTKDDIINAFNNSIDKFDIIITTGGLGPTNDDITKDVFCEFFNDKLIHNQELLVHIENLFKNFVDNPINDLNRAQALVPSKALLIENQYGTAAGMQIMTYGVGESTIAKKLKDFEDGLSKNFKLAYLPNLGRVRLRLSCRGFDRTDLEKKMDNYIAQLFEILGKIIIGFESVNSIESEIGKILKKSGKTLSTAESFTGGLISSRISSVPGASSYFKGAVVAYDTNIKQNLLSVNQNDIDLHSVVSSQVANSMALNAKKLLKTDYAISTTGNAGPDKGDSKKEVGSIYISLATLNDVKSYEFNFGKNREKNIKKSVNKALELLFSELLTED